MDKIEDLLKASAAATPMTGAAVICGNSKGITLEKYFGTIHPTQSSSVNSQTLFDLQSISKVVSTAAVVSEYFHESKNMLSEYACDYISELESAPYHKITIEHLLQHQSGFSDEDFALDFDSSDHGWKKMYSLPLRFEPGENVEYSDVGYRLLGKIIEKIGKDKLGQLSQKHVWQKLNMQHTTYEACSIDRSLIAGQGQSWGRVDDEIDYKLGGHLGCDGVFSTAKDLANFCHSILVNKNTLLKSYLKPVGDKHNKASFFDSLVFGQKYCGWEKHSQSNSYAGSRVTELTLEKAGGAGAFIVVLPERDLYAIYLTNHGRPDPFTADSWNNLIRNLKVQNIFEVVLS